MLNLDKIVFYWNTMGAVLFLQLRGLKSVIFHETLIKYDPSDLVYEYLRIFAVTLIMIED